MDGGSRIGGCRVGLTAGWWRMMLMVILALLSMTGRASSQGDAVSTAITAVRLQNASRADRYQAGRAQVKVDGRWRTLCGDHFTVDEAATVCSMLGFKTGMVAPATFYGDGTDPMYEKTLYCGTDESHLENCNKYDVTLPCSAAGVVCFNKTEDVLDLRLVGGQKAGKVETGLLEGQVLDWGWGRFCSFDPVSIPSADLACQHMGYMYGEVTDDWTRPDPSQTRRYSMTWCAENCLKVEPGSDGHCRGAHAAMRCVGAPVRLQTTRRDVLDVGRVEMYLPGSGWLQVCDENWEDVDAYVVCKELGFADGQAQCCNKLGGDYWSNSVYGPIVTGVQCSRSDAHLANCSKDTLGAKTCPGDINRRASVICFTAPVDQIDMSFKTRLTHQGEATSAGWGHVEVRYKGYWGDVCPDRFTDAEAAAACRPLGYSDGTVHGYGMRKTGARHLARLPVWLSSVSCQGNETSLDKCDVGGWGKAYASTCLSTAYVICYRSELTLKLATPNLHYGSLQVVRDGVSGKVCGDGFNDHAAGVACQTLGYWGGKVLKGDVMTALNGPPYLSEVRCTGGVRDLFLCHSRWNDAPAPCDAATQQAAVTCFKDIELRYGTNHRSGMVVVRGNDTHSELGAICATGFDDNTAKVVCMQMGFRDGQALPASAYGWRDNILAQQLNGLRCAGTEKQIWDCPRNTTQQDNCLIYSRNYASVSCFDSTESQEKYSLDLGPEEGQEAAGQVNVFDKQTVGFVCPEFWTDAAAKVLCKQLGHAGGVVYDYPGDYAGPYFVSKVTCEGTETGLDGCSFANTLCQYLGAAGVLCYDSSAPTVSMVKEGKVPGRGRVKIQVDGVDGRVCGRHWDDQDARVACRSLGHKDGIALRFPRSPAPTVVVMFEMNCAGNEESLFRCRNLGWRRNTSSSCSGPDDTEAGVMCFDDVKVTGGRIDAGTVSGLLEASTGPGRWSLVCGDSADAAVRRVACRQLGGFQDGALLRPQPVRAPYPVLLVFTCGGQEENLGLCSNTTTVYCRNQARLFCFNATDDQSWRWSIQHGYHGQVKVTHKGVDGAVCKTGWGDAEADTLCRQQGHKGGVALGLEVGWSSPVQMTWLGTVGCPENAQGMGQCSLNTSVPVDCREPDTMSAAVLCYNVSAPVLRLVGGRNQGRLQIEYDGVNGTVCYEGSPDRNYANHACRQLGFAAGRTSSAGPFGGGSGPVYLSNLHCGDAGDGQGNLFTCPSAGWSQSPPACQDHSRDVAVFCYPAVKLDISDSVGPVLLLVNNAYRLVCASGFDDRAARVVCRELGFQTGLALYPGAFGASSKGFGVDQVQCAGSEVKFEDCRMDKGSRVSCQTPGASYASVVCGRDSSAAYKVKLEKQDHGFVVVQHYDHDGYICANGYDNQDAMILCKEAGFLTGFAYHSLDTNSDNDIRWLDNLNCTGTENRLDQCRQGNRPLEFGKYEADVSCEKASAFCANTREQTTVTWRLTKDGTTASASGRVEVKINGTWGTVCAENFDQNEVDVLCRQMGYDSGTAVGNTLTDSRPVWVTGLQCTGTEDNLLDCQLKLGNHRDNCYEDAAASCDARVRLRSPKGATAMGYLQAVQKTGGAGGKWPTVCASGFGNHSALLACRELGHAAGFYQTYQVKATEEDTFGSANITCPSGQDSRFEQCTVSADAFGECPQGEYVYLFCAARQDVPENLHVTLDQFTGPVSVSRRGFGGVVCGRNFTDAEARVTCRELGYRNGFAVKPFMAHQNPTVLSQLSCAGTERAVSQCSRGVFVDSMTDCADGGVAHVLCTPTSGPVQYRVNPEGSFSGRAEVKFGAEWKRVANDFSEEVALVFCKSAGYAAGETWYDSGLALPSLPFAVGSLKCTGAETSLLQCEGDWGLELRSSYGYSDAYVRCSHSVRLVGGSSNSNGMLQYRSNYGWGEVCGVGFDDKDAGVVCREMGYDYGQSYNCCLPHGLTYVSYVMANVDCVGTEGTLGECPHSTDSTDLYGCSMLSYASLACYNSNDTKDYNISFRAGSGNVGEIVLTYLGVQGRICSDGWDDTDANVTCHELGYRHGQAYKHFRNYYFPDYFGPFWASDFNCRGDESRLQDCPHTAVGEVTDCENVHMAGALCYEDSGVAFKLVGNQTNYGRVEIHVDGKWGTICSGGFNESAVEVFCRSQGFVDGDLRDVPSGLPDASAVPVYLTDMRCQGTESSLMECPHRGWTVAGQYSYCSGHVDDVGVLCYVTVRLSTEGMNHGAVRLFHNGSWVDISDNNFDDFTAGEVCRELGFADGRGVCCSAYTGSLSYQTNHTTELSLHCQGQESSLAECVHKVDVGSGLYPSVICMKDTSLNDTDYKIDFADDDKAEGTGRLKVDYLNVVGRICAINWTDEDAMVFCKSKGYPFGFAYIHSDKSEYKSHEEIGPYLLSNFSCTGNETSLMDCPHNDRLNLGNCSSGHSAGVACYRTSSVKYRLTPGTSNTGRVQMEVDGVWGTVCNEGWDDQDAEVFCRSLSFTGGVAVPNDGFDTVVSANSPIWLRDIQCNGTETALHKCPHTGFTEELDDSGWWWFVPACSDHEDDAAVLCYKNVRLNLGDSSMGGVEVYHDKKWQAVCDENFDDNAATVVCKGLFKNFQYGIAIEGSAFGASDVPLGIQSVGCTGQEGDILECSISTSGSCASGHYASVACGEKPFNDTGFQVRITNDTFSGKAWGIVEISKKGLWRKICHQGWDDDDADVVCKQNDFKGGVNYVHIINHRRPLGFRNFTCSGSESSLKDCPFDTSPDLDECSYTDLDAGVLCYNSTGVSYRLGGNNGTAGRVEIVYDGQPGAVCSHYWSYNDSRVFCRSVGFHDGLPLEEDQFQDPPRELGHYYINAPFCTGAEESLLACLTTGFNSSYLSYYCYEEAYVQCYNVTFSITDIRLVLADGRPGKSEGRVEVFVSGPDRWGTVCDDYWDDFDASVACVMLGYKWGVAITNQTHGEGEGQIWLDNVECQGTESTLDDCIHRGYGAHNCWHFEDAGVACYNTTKPTLPPTIPTIPPTTPSPTTPKPTTPKPTTPKPTTPKPTTPKPTTPKPTTPKPTPPTTPLSPTTATKEPTTEVSEREGTDKTVPIAVGVVVGLLVIVLIVVIVVVVVIRRRKPKIPHQRFSDDVLASGQDGSLSMHNQMFDGSLDDAATKRMAGEGEITLGGDRAMYVPDQQQQQQQRQQSGDGSAEGFSNPLYSVMQPFRLEGSTPGGQHNGRPGGDGNEA